MMIFTRSLLALTVFSVVSPILPWNSQHVNGVNAENRQESFQQRISNGSCIVPLYPENGKNEVAGAPAAFPGQAFDNIQLNISCSPGFSVIGNSVLFCINGIWSDELSKCTRSCKVEQHPSVDYTCIRLEGGFRRCNDHEPVGTVMKASCNHGYYNDGDLNNMNCTESGWDYVALCSPDCGRITISDDQKVVGGGGWDATFGEFPWHTGVYKLEKRSGIPSYYQQICGGSLLSTTVVISAAHCFWDGFEQKPWPASMFHVAVGKRYPLWNDPNDNRTVQQSDVREIKIPARFQGAATNFQDDIAILVLSTAITYKTYIKPVCVDFDSLFEQKQLQSGNNGKVAGWGLTSADGTPALVLTVVGMPYVDIVQCIQETSRGFTRYITSDKICAGFANGSALCRGDSGGGLVFPELNRGTERYYLRGIASTAPTSDDACNLFARTSFTLISAHKSFIEENTVLHTSSKQVSFESNINASPKLCVLPAYPDHGLYAISGTPTAYPGEAFRSVQLNIICDAGYAADGNKTLYCREGIWSGNLPRCKRSCKLDRNPGVLYRCLVIGTTDQLRDCSDEEPSGAVIRPQCGAEDLPLMRCDDGSWSTHPICSPDCGRVEIQAKGVKVERGVVPWLALIYRKIEKVGNETTPATSSYNIWCSGTLVSTTVVISAAQCFWSHTNEQVPASRYAVAVDKVYSKWDDIRDLMAQKSLVTDVKIPSRFRGHLTNLQNDISLVILSTAVTFSTYVKPVCLDFNIDRDRNQLQEGNVGKTFYLPIVYDEIDEVFEIMDVSNVDIDVCIAEKEALGLIEYVTADKNCVRALKKKGEEENEKELTDEEKAEIEEAQEDEEKDEEKDEEEYEEDSSPVSTAKVCRVSSGAGVFFPETSGGIERYYLRGIMSPSQPILCSLNTSLGVTHILSHENFLKKYLML